MLTWASPSDLLWKPWIPPPALSRRPGGTCTSKVVKYNRISSDYRAEFLKKGYPVQPWFTFSSRMSYIVLYLHERDNRQQWKQLEAWIKYNSRCLFHVVRKEVYLLLISAWHVAWPYKDNTHRRQTLFVFKSTVSAKGLCGSCLSVWVSLPSLGFLSWRGQVIL